MLVNTGLVGGAYSNWRGHVIVCGLPGVGLRIVEQLTLSGVPAVVVDDNPDPPLARMLGTWDVPLITGSARAEDTLVSAGLAGAIAVICAQHDDLRTLETALLARRLRADVRVVAQLNNPAVGRAVKQVGISVLDVAGLSAPSVVEACLRSGVQPMHPVRRAVPRRADDRPARGQPPRALRRARPRRGRVPRPAAT